MPADCIAELIDMLAGEFPPKQRSIALEIEHQWRRQWGGVRVYVKKARPTLDVQSGKIGAAIKTRW